MSNSAPHKVVMPDRCQDFFFLGGGWLWGLILTAQVFKFWCSFFPNNPPNQTISHTSFGAHFSPIIPQIRPSVTQSKREKIQKKHSKKSHQNHRLKPAQVPDRLSLGPFQPSIQKVSRECPRSVKKLIFLTLWGHSRDTSWTPRSAGRGLKASGDTLSDTPSDTPPVFGDALGDGFGLKGPERPLAAGRGLRKSSVHIASLSSRLCCRRTSRAVLQRHPESSLMRQVLAYL